MKKIAFIGLGDMGTPMATNLLNRGYPLTAYDILTERISRLASRGARAAASPEEASREADVVITMLPTSLQVEKAILGPSGVRDGIPEGATAIDFSSVDPKLADRVSDALMSRKAQYLDAAVSGVPPRAAAGELTIAIGGDEELVNAHRDILEVLGKRIFYVGAIGNAKKIKIANNTLAAINQMALYEICVLLQKAGIDLDVFFQVLRECSGYSRVADRLPDYIGRRFDATGRGGRIRHLHKDIGLGVSLAEELRVATPFSSLAQQLARAAIAQGMEEEGGLSLAKVLERLSNLQP